MFNSTVLEVAIGIVACYGSLALIVSSINEAIASLLGLRAKTLLTGIKSILNDPQFVGLARAVYNTALVSPRDGGNAVNQADLASPPSYVPPLQFANALISVVQRVPGDFGQLGTAIGQIEDPQLRQLLGGFYEESSGSLDHFRAQVAGWFDNAMDRVSGLYKRWSQLYCFLIALALSVGLNIDTFHLFRTLWQHQALAAEANIVNTSDAWAALQGLPLGWSSFPPALDAALPLTVMGWLVSATSSLFGAPFWFDILQPLTQLRSTGPRPDTQVVASALAASFGRPLAQAPAAIEGHAMQDIGTCARCGRTDPIGVIDFACGDGALLRPDCALAKSVLAVHTAPAAMQGVAVRSPCG